MNIYCVGRNYALHAKELGNEIPSEPLIFGVTESSLRSFEVSPMAFETETFHYEAELVLKIGKDHALNEKYSQQSVSDLAFGIDLTRREVQTKLKNKGAPWLLSKSFLGSSLIGKFYSFDQFKKLENIEYEFYLNGKLRQKGMTENMLFNFSEIINYINTFSPLKKGDLIYTGTPEGVGEIHKQDKFQFVLPQLNISESGQL